jgi:transcriptional regulator with GAF, ATPase, and Fis domain
VVFDPSRERGRDTTRLLSDLGAALAEVPPSYSIPDPSIEPVLYLVGLGNSLPEGTLLTDWIALCHRNTPVIAYGDGITSWPVRSKAALLLAGCTALVDLAPADGGARLRNVVSSVLARELTDSADHRAAREALEAGGLIGESNALLAVGRWLTRVGPLSDTPALITGDTGTGKELVARAIHRLDPLRRAGPFVPVNCASLSPSLAESDLFGHRRGAFTGAQASRLGFVRSAQGGVLLLDEVGDLEPGLQAKLLRVLQDQRVVAVGEDRESSVDVRVVAATNRDLDRMVDAGTFRRDLFHRLSIVTLRLPPLRERREDIRPLVRHFVAKHQRPHAAVPELEPEALQALQELDYPGNVRELENLTRAALALAPPGGPIGLADLPPATLLQLLAHVTTAPSREPPDPPGSDLDRLAGDICRGERTLDAALEECERTFLRRTLEHTHSNQASAARLLGVSARAVYRKLRRLGVNV